jgi:hypothetical protein
MPSLAFIFEIAERAVSSSVGSVGLKVGTPSTRMISLNNALLAIQWCEYLESHARRVYSIFSPEVGAAQLLGEKIKQRAIGAEGSFTCRDVYLKGWRGLSKPEEVKAAATVLEEKRWIEAVNSESGRTGGRPSDKYRVNPRVLSLQSLGE